MAAGTRTAPTVNGTPQYQLLSFAFIDASGDKRSVTIQAPAAATSAQVEAIAAAYQATTQASLWAVTVNMVYEGDADSDNAEVGSRDSVFDNVTTLIKNTARVSRDFFIPAPAPEVMFGDQDAVDPASTELLALYTAVLAVSSGFTVRSARYTERREINKKVNF